MSIETFWLERQKKELEATAVKLLLEELEFDLQSYRVYVQNLGQHDAQVARQQVVRDAKLANEALAAAELYLERHATEQDFIITLLMMYF